jgi:type II secretion system protein G
MRYDKGFTLIELLIVIAIIGIIAAIAIPSLLNALDRARQATTVSNVVQMGQGCDRYIQDHPKQGAPQAGDIEELQTIFEETEINLNKGMARDGWGYLLHYSFDASGDGRRFTVESYGSDGASGGLVAVNENNEYIVKHFDEDIIYVNGRLLQYPEGAQTSNQN